MRQDRELQEWALRGLTSLRLLPQYKEPVRPQSGLIVYADGVEWDPGSGEGLYYYNAAGVWVFLGP